MKLGIFPLAGALLASTLTASGAVVSINLTNVDNPRQILAADSTGVIDTTGWVNLGGTDSNVGGSVIDITVSGTLSTSNTVRDNSSPDGTDGFLALYEAGLKDSTAGTAGDTSITISDLSAFLSAEGASSYNVYAYYKSPLANTTPDTVALGLTTSSLTTVDPDGALMSVADSFVAAGNAESNYIVFSGLTADSTTIYMNRVSRDGLLVGIQIEAIPEPATALLGFLGLLGLLSRRR